MCVCVCELLMCVLFSLGRWGQRTRHCKANCCQTAQVDQVHYFSADSLAAPRQVRSAYTPCMYKHVDGILIWEWLATLFNVFKLLYMRIGVARIPVAQIATYEGPLGPWALKIEPGALKGNATCDGHCGHTSLLSTLLCRSPKCSPGLAAAGSPR